MIQTVVSTTYCCEECRVTHQRFWNVEWGSQLPQPGQDLPAGWLLVNRFTGRVRCDRCVAAKAAAEAELEDETPEEKEYDDE